MQVYGNLHEDFIILFLPSFIFKLLDNHKNKFYGSFIKGVMMENRVPLIQTSELFLQASNLMISTLPLQQQIQTCHDELTVFLRLEAATQAEMARISDLKDQIWGCCIEVQSLRLKAKRLLKKARYIRFGDVEKPIESASHC